MIKCVAVDDEPLALRQICNYIKKTPFLELSGSFESPLLALDLLKRGNIDLIYIDINMPDISGLDFVKSLDSPPMIVFVTAYSQYALEGFRVDAVDYLLKPISYAEFLKSAGKVRSWFESRQNLRSETGKDKEFLFVKADYKILRINFDKITYIEGMSEYIKIHLSDSKPVMTLLSMKAVEELLPSERFMRVHRSYIVNLSRISVIERSRIVFEGKVYIPVSDQYKAAFQKYLDDNFLS